MNMLKRFAILCVAFVCTNSQIMTAIEALNGGERTALVWLACAIASVAGFWLWFVYVDRLIQRGQENLDAPEGRIGATHD